MKVWATGRQVKMGTNMARHLSGNKRQRTCLVSSAALAYQHTIGTLPATKTTAVVATVTAEVTLTANRPAYWRAQSNIKVFIC